MHATEVTLANTSRKDWAAPQSGCEDAKESRKLKHVEALTCAARRVQREYIDLQQCLPLRNKARWSPSEGKTVGTMIVWVIDAQPLLRAGLRAQLTIEGFEVTAEAATVGEMVSGFRDNSDPDLIILDSVHGPNAIATLKSAQPKARTVVFAETAELSELADMFDAGADGYLLKRVPSSTLGAALKLVAAGEKVFPSAVARMLSKARNPAHDTTGHMRIGDVTLSHSEREIARYVADGRSNKSIAKELSVTESTVKVRLKTILRKIRAGNRTQLAVWALRHGLTSISSAVGLGQPPSAGD